MRSMVITGATSFIGQQLITACRNTWDMTAVVRPGSTDRVPKGIRTVELDLTDYGRLGAIAGPCDCFVHLAWNGTRGASRMDAARQQSNLEESLQAVRAMLEAGCGRIVTAGSQAEYGPQNGQITEETRCCPNTEYGKAKLAFYEAAGELCCKSGAILIEPRFFSLYGPGDYEGTMVISTLRNMLANQPCRFTQGVQMWDFLFLDDAVRALALLCESPDASGVYNFGSGDTRPLRNYIEEMARITGTTSELLFGAVPYPETGMVSLWPDISRLRKVLRWVPQVPFAEGIRTILKTMNDGAVL